MGHRMERMTAGRMERAMAGIAAIGSCSYGSVTCMRPLRMSALAHIVECALLELAVHEAVVERIFAVPAEHLLALGERADDAPRLSCDVLGRRLGRGARSCSCRAGANWLQRYDMVWVSNPP